MYKRQAPREGDVRLGPVTYVGEVPTDSGAAAVYEIVISRYTLHRADENDPGSWDFFSADTQFIVLRLDGEGIPTQVLGVAPTQPSRDIQAIVYEALYGLLSGDVTFLRDGWNTPIGPGMDLSFSCLDVGSMETEQLEDYEPIYHDGDYWYRVSANYPTGTFTALCYHLSLIHISTWTGIEGASTVAHYRFDGSSLEEAAQWDYYSDDGLSDQKAVPVEGGLELYSLNPEWGYPCLLYTSSNISAYHILIHQIKAQGSFQAPYW